MQAGFFVLAGAEIKIYVAVLLAALRTGVDAQAFAPHRVRLTAVNTLRLPSGQLGLHAGRFIQQHEAVFRRDGCAVVAVGEVDVASLRGGGDNGFILLPRLVPFAGDIGGNPAVGDVGNRGEILGVILIEPAARVFAREIGVEELGKQVLKISAPEPTM